MLRLQAKPKFKVGDIVFAPDNLFNIGRMWKARIEHVNENCTYTVTFDHDYDNEKVHRLPEKYIKVRKYYSPWEKTQPWFIEHKTKQKTISKYLYDSDEEEENSDQQDESDQQDVEESDVMYNLQCRSNLFCRWFVARSRVVQEPTQKGGLVIGDHAITTPRKGKHQTQQIQMFQKQKFN